MRDWNLSVGALYLHFRSSLGRVSEFHHRGRPGWSPDFMRAVGGLLPIAPCGRSSLQYLRQASIFSRASARVRNQWASRHSARKRPLIEWPMRDLTVSRIDRDSQFTPCAGDLRPGTSMFRYHAADAGPSVQARSSRQHPKLFRLEICARPQSVQELSECAASDTISAPNFHRQNASLDRHPFHGAAGRWRPLARRVSGRPITILKSRCSSAGPRRTHSRRSRSRQRRRTAHS